MGNVQDTLGIDFRTCEFDKPVIINTTNSPPSYIGSFLLAAKANASVAQKKKKKKKMLISTNDRNRLEMQTRTALVESKFRIVEQKLPYTISTTNDYSTDASMIGWGAVCQGKTTHGM